MPGHFTRSRRRRPRVGWRLFRLQRGDRRMCKHLALLNTTVGSALVVLLVAGPVFGFLDAGRMDEKKAFQEYHQSLRGDQVRTEWEVIGWETEQSVRFEPAGLRIVLP